MSPICQRLDAVLKRIERAQSRYGRDPRSVGLIAVSKTRPAEELRTAFACGQRRFGESYLQEALTKIRALDDLAIEWHFIGRVQGNKTRAIAEHFDWVHSIDNPKHARRLSEQRPDDQPPLNLCLQVKLDSEGSKGGLDVRELPRALEEIRTLPKLRVRGLMTLPAPRTELAAQRMPFRQLRELRDRLASATLPLDTLSMGMSADMEAAIAEGASLVRIGTAIFGPRDPSKQGIGK
jgi:pyridoxal phosphate enzyme (YggS family)